MVCDDYKRWHIWQQANAIIARKHFVKSKEKQRSQMLYFRSINMLHNCVCCNLICFHFHPSDPILEQNIGLVQNVATFNQNCNEFCFEILSIFFNCFLVATPCKSATSNMSREILSFLPSDDWSEISPMYWSDISPM